MGLEDFTPEIESSETGGQSAETTKESSEKFKEQQKKSGAKIAKVGKDEKKAKKYDFLLAGFLVKIIVDKKYDSLLESLFSSIHLGYPSNFILGILSLVNIEISNKIREISNKNLINFKYKNTNEIIEFNDNNIPSEIKERINSWVEDIIDSITIEYSNIQTDKLKILLETDKDILKIYISKIFTFFLKELNINISKTKSNNISEFIISEIKDKTKNLKIENI